MKIKSPYLIKPHTKVRLSKLKTDAHPGFADEAATEPALQKLHKRLDAAQERLYAGSERAVLIVLQGMDTAGKDGAIRGIFRGLNPQGVQVASFKVPTSLEARHDFLWRCHAQVPPRGMVGIFNRSHYEDVLQPRVHGNMSAKEADRHLDEINAFESTLNENGVTILKFFLHISREEQARRLQARLDDASKHWKLSPADFTERTFWPAYMDAYEDILHRTSAKHAPWFVIPADHKWYRNVAIAEVLADALEGLKLQFPKAVVGDAELATMQGELRGAGQKRGQGPGPRAQKAG